MVESSIIQNPKKSLILDEDASGRNGIRRCAESEAINQRIDHLVNKR